MMTKVFWLFGRSGAGKTTLANSLCSSLRDRNLSVFILDGDEARSGLCSDLDFSSASRIENHRRIAQVARLAADQGFNVVVSTMAPEHPQRDAVAAVLAERLVWIYVHAPLNICIERDPKGLYRRARDGQVRQLLNYPFDVPRPHEREIYIDTVAGGPAQCAEWLLEEIRRHLSDYAI